MGFWAGGGRVGEGEVAVGKRGDTGRVGVVLGVKALLFMFHVEHPATDFHPNASRAEVDRGADTLPSRSRGV